MKVPMKLIYIFKLKHGDKMECRKIGENTWEILLIERNNLFVYVFILSPGSVHCSTRSI